ncbi:basic salivary proline-rich protein 1-like [Polyodon spathula]|uniref:basic salivary proline-rich protein 1-like n=1 Tax=Polyodon spathula TaxID=7913 RepID=UPI001B7EAEEF|nr:basic salivary proline-rich protein 1-like [Polyodon spathula]
MPTLASSNSNYNTGPCDVLGSLPEQRTAARASVEEVNRGLRTIWVSLSQRARPPPPASFGATPPGGSEKKIQLEHVEGGDRPPPPRLRGSPAGLSLGHTSISDFRPDLVVWFGPKNRAGENPREPPPLSSGGRVPKGARRRFGPGNPRRRPAGAFGSRPCQTSADGASVAMVIQSARDRGSSQAGQGSRTSGRSCSRRGLPQAAPPFPRQQLDPRATPGTRPVSGLQDLGSSFQGPLPLKAESGLQDLGSSRQQQKGTQVTSTDSPCPASSRGSTSQGTGAKFQNVLGSRTSAAAARARPFHFRTGLSSRTISSMPAAPGATSTAVQGSRTSAAASASGAPSTAPKTGLQDLRQQPRAWWKRPSTAQDLGSRSSGGQATFQAARLQAPGQPPHPFQRKKIRTRAPGRDRQPPRLRGSPAGLSLPHAVSGLQTRAS